MTDRFRHEDTLCLRPHLNEAPSLLLRGRGSEPSGLTPVDMEDLAGDKGGPFEVEDPVHDVAAFAEPAEGMKFRHARIGGEVVGCPYDAESNSVHTNPA